MSGSACFRLLIGGFSVVDSIAGKRHLGGAGGLTALNAAHLGHQVSLVSSFSDDRDGRWYRQQLATAGIDTAYSVTNAAGMPTCVVDDPLQPNSARVWSDNGALVALQQLSIEPGILDGFNAVLLCNAPPPMVQQALAGYTGDNLFYTPGPAMIKHPERLSAAALARSRVVFANEEEGPNVLAADPLALGATTVVVTKGRRGWTVHTAGGEIDHPCPDVAAIDPTGAGDAFALGFALGLLKDGTMAAASESAAALSSRVVAKFGGLLYKE